MDKMKATNGNGDHAMGASDGGVTMSLVQALLGVLRSMVDALAKRVGCRPKPVDEDHVEALVRTVGLAVAKSDRGQRQFAQWRLGGDEVGGVIIRPRISNKCLAWEMSGEGVKKRTCKADPANPAAIPQKLLDKRARLVERRTHVSPASEAAIDVAMGKMGLTQDREPEIILSIQRLWGAVAGSGLAADVIDFARQMASYANQWLKLLGTIGKASEMFAVLDQLLREHVAAQVKVLRGVPISYLMMRYAAINARELYARRIRQIKRRLLLFLTWCHLHRADIALPDFLGALGRRRTNRWTDEATAFLAAHGLTMSDIRRVYREVNKNVNELVGTEMQRFISSFPQDSQLAVLKLLRSLLSKAGTMPQFRRNGQSIITTNALDDVVALDPRAYPICILTPQQVRDVLISAFRDHPMEAIPILAELTLGLRPTEASGGADRRHREQDRLSEMLIEFFEFAGGLWGCGTVRIPQNKDTAALKKREYRVVDLTPSAAAWWRIVIAALHAIGRTKGTLWQGSAAKVREARREIFDSVGITDAIAERCEVTADEVGVECQANKSIGRNTFLTYLFWAVVEGMSKDAILVRRMAGHSKDSHALEKSYLGLATLSIAVEYVRNTLPPPGLSFDPEHKAWLEQQREDGAARRRGNWDEFVAADADAAKAKIQKMHDARRRMMNDPGKGEAYKKQIGDRIKAKWAALPQEEKDRRGALMREGRRRKREERERNGDGSE